MLWRCLIAVVVFGVLGFALAGWIVYCGAQVHTERADGRSAVAVRSPVGPPNPGVADQSP